MSERTISAMPTPETDEFAIKFKTTCGEKYWVPVDIARKLERERDEAREEANKLSGAYEDATNYYARIIELKDELDKLNTQLKQNTK